MRPSCPRHTGAGWATYTVFTTVPFGELIPSGGAIEATIDAERGAARLRRFAINTDRGVVFGDPDTVEVLA
ncbi:hypothetical protein GII30_11630 [Gordonia amarae]|uniref:Uncharacterized protein n=1 Tax=Gordonia amarae TaxID=36821 RepID=A0A857KKC0_9ACTN|nr:hypothetical protein [Gordonia amarae]MCS3879035.1 hypothetical protein [Gordonia amarae]QHN17575.1 hypothetical protein GII35_11840 [Gordonia amarae]QHN22101.1 hypothetical protein GII34_11620 [Gordonia amarae]QHN30982.1 hypothetical protein GII32_11795 [Gordonia amarae]QHN39728.1 hypothetical protein GII30_11630 [Gordonia amarae]